MKWFVCKWLQRDPSVLCVTTIVYPNNTSIAQARQDVSSHLVKKCADDQSNPVEPGVLECNLTTLTGSCGICRQLLAGVLLW